MTLQEALALVGSQRAGVLVTLRRDGRPQTSNVVYAVQENQVRISVTEDRAKTRNLRRDPRAVLHVTTPDQAAWAAVDGTVTLSPTSSAPGDDTGKALAELYTAIAGQAHPDWQEYHRAMVEERRLLVTLTVTCGYGGRAG